MPEGDVRVNRETGDVFELQKLGNDLQWVPIEGDKAAAVQAAELGPVGAGLSGAAESGSSLLGLLTGGQSESASQANPALFEAQRRQSPGAFLGGQLGVDASLLGAPFLGAARSGRLAEGVQGAIRSQARRVTETGSRQLVRRPSDILGRASVTGGAVRILEATAEAVPGLNLPGIAQKAINQRRINQSFAKAMGLSDESAAAARGGVTENFLDEALTGLNARFRQVETAITSSLDQAGARSAFELAADEGLISGKLANTIRTNTPLTGKDVMAMRSQMSKILRSNEQFLVKERVRQQIESIDDLIQAALQQTDEATVELFREARARWRVWANVRTGRGLSPDGQVNARTVSGRLANAYGDAFRAGRPIQGVPEDVNGFLSIVREGAKLDVGLPSSGTAERAVGAAVIGGTLAGT